MKTGDLNHAALLTVIVAETYPLSRAALADLLAGDGYRVFQSDNANSAILCVDQNTHLAVLLVDLDMPGWKSLIRHAQAVAPQALIVAMLGTRAFAEDPDLKGRGIFVCLPKPIVYPHLQQAIQIERAGRIVC